MIPRQFQSVGNLAYQRNWQNNIFGYYYGIEKTFLASEEDFEDLFKWEASDEDIFIPTNGFRKTLCDKYDITYGTGISRFLTLLVSRLF